MLRDELRAPRLPGPIAAPQSMSPIPDPADPVGDDHRHRRSDEIPVIGAAIGTMQLGRIVRTPVREMDLRLHTVKSSSL